MHADNWALKAKQMGYRSRAVFKLEEILDKLHNHKSYKNLGMKITTLRTELLNLKIIIYQYLLAQYLILQI